MPPTGSATPTFGANNLNVARQPQITVADAECPTHGSQFAGSATVSARGQTLTVPIGGNFDCRGEEMTLHSETVLRLSDFGIWVPVGFISDQLLINADITLRRQR
jgi:hypothetical protein